MKLKLVFIALYIMGLSSIHRLHRLVIKAE